MTIRNERIQNVQCRVCKVERTVEDFFHTRPAVIDGETDIGEVGLLCPSCGEWVHSFYQSPHTRRLQANLSRAEHMVRTQRTKRALKAYRRAKRSHQLAFDALQARLRQKTGAASPIESLGQTIVDVPKSDK